MFQQSHSRLEIKIASSSLKIWISWVWWMRRYGWSHSHQIILSIFELQEIHDIKTQFWRKWRALGKLEQWLKLANWHRKLLEGLTIIFSSIYPNNMHIIHGALHSAIFVVPNFCHYSFEVYGILFLWVNA